MEKNIKRYTVTTVLEYDKDGDVIREERCEDTEYYDPNGEPETTCTPINGYMQFAYPTNPMQYPSNATYSSNPNVVPTTPSGKSVGDLLHDYTNL